MKVPLSVGDGDGNSSFGDSKRAIWTRVKNGSRYTNDKLFVAPKDGFLSIKTEKYRPGHSYGNHSGHTRASGGRVYAKGVEYVTFENTGDLHTIPVKKGETVVYQGSCSVVNMNDVDSGVEWYRIRGAERGYLGNSCSSHFTPLK